MCVCVSAMGRKPLRSPPQSPGPRELNARVSFARLPLRGARAGVQRAAREFRGRFPRRNAAPGPARGGAGRAGGGAKCRGLGTARPSPGRVTVFGAPPFFREPLPPPRGGRPAGVPGQVCDGPGSGGGGPRPARAPAWAGRRQFARARLVLGAAAGSLQRRVIQTGVRCYRGDRPEAFREPMLPVLPSRVRYVLIQMGCLRLYLCC